MARPKVENPRTEIIRVRLTPQEKEALQRAAKEQGTKESTLAYDMLLRGNLTQLVEKFFGRPSQISTTEPS